MIGPTSLLSMSTMSGIMGISSSPQLRALHRARSSEYWVLFHELEAGRRGFGDTGHNDDIYPTMALYQILTVDQLKLMVEKWE